MHILQIYKDYHPVLGGIENHVRDIAEGLAERGHRVTVLVTSLTGRTEVQQPWPGLTVLKAARVLHLASTPLSLAMPRLARDLRPDLVHLHFPYPPGDLVYWQMHPRPPLVMEGSTTFHFVTDGPAAAQDRARDAAGAKDVRVGGGINVIQQYLRQRLIDEMHIAISPVLLGTGERLFDGVDLPALGYACVRQEATARATHVILARQ